MAAGLWRQSAAGGWCHYYREGAWWWQWGSYSCGCVRISTLLNWQANTACLTRPRAVDTPPVCRFSKFQDTTAWTMGYYRDNRCYAIGENFGEYRETVM